MHVELEVLFVGVLGGRDEGQGRRTSKEEEEEEEEEDEDEDEDEEDEGAGIEEEEEEEEEEASWFLKTLNELCRRPVLVEEALERMTFASAMTASHHRALRRKRKADATLDIQW